MPSPTVDATAGGGEDARRAAVRERRRAARGAHEPRRDAHRPRAGAAAGATQSIASGPAARAATGASDPNWHANGGNDACVSSAPSPTTATETVMPPTSHPAAGATPAARVDGTTSSVAAPSSAVHASPPSVTSRSWNAPPPPPAASGDSHAASADDTNAAETRRDAAEGAQHGARLARGVVLGQVDADDARRRARRSSPSRAASRAPAPSAQRRT